MADDKQEGVYGENLERGTFEEGIREETVEAHPQPTGDTAADGDAVDAADDVRARGAEAIEGSVGSPENDLEAVRRGAGQETGSGGMGRESVPANATDSQGEFTPIEDKPNTPG